LERVVYEKEKKKFLGFFSGQERIVVLLFKNFLARGGVYIILAGNFKGSHFEFFAKIVVRGNAVQIFSNFPAKRLSI